MPHEDTPSTKLTRRLNALLAALHDGPLPRPELLERLGNAYPQGNSRRVMVDRDTKMLRELGMSIEISRTRPPVYTLHGGTPNLQADDLHRVLPTSFKFEGTGVRTAD